MRVPLPGAVCGEAPLTRRCAPTSPPEGEVCLGGSGSLNLLPLDRLRHDLMVGEMVLRRSDDLVVLVALAGNQQDITGFERLDRRGDRRLAVADFLGPLGRREDFRADGLGVF